MARSETAARLQADIITAMKARDKERLGVLRMMQAALKDREVNERKELDENDVVEVLTKYGRKVKDQLQGCRDAGRDEQVAVVEAELAIVGAYLPAELGDEELAVLVDEAIAEVGASGPRDMGQVMKTVMPKVGVRAEGSRVSALVKARLIAPRSE